MAKSRSGGSTSNEDADDEPNLSPPPSAADQRPAKMMKCKFTFKKKEN